MRVTVTALMAFASVWAQAPTGTIAGLVTDPAGAAIVRARVVVKDTATGLNRKTTTSAEGTYSTPSLPAGAYDITAQAAGFSKLTRTAAVEAGTTTTVNLDMQVGATSDTVTVDSASPQIRYDSPQVGDVVHRDQIQELPLNGRSFLELAKLEPGVTPPTRQTNNRTFVSVLGAPRVGTTRTTVDGGSIMQLGAPGSVMNLSQEIVQEFQIVTVNMDNSTGITAQGGINIVTRSGGNALLLPAREEMRCTVARSTFSATIIYRRTLRLAAIRTIWIHSFSASSGAMRLVDQSRRTASSSSPRWKETTSGAWRRCSRKETSRPSQGSTPISFKPIRRAPASTSGSMISTLPSRVTRMTAMTVWRRLPVW
jgi:hypothetical protein